ncbi:MAG: DUF3685 domain-containing protein [Nostocaceae cyanobacterium]|nr:DUF3685 domain-containing protein [Nostocaceae cyanobacterium]
MSDRPLKLLLIDQDPIFRLGLQVMLSEVPHIQVIDAVESDTIALQILADLSAVDPAQVNLLVLELGNPRSLPSQQLGLQLCKQLKSQYPNLPLFLLSSIQVPGLLLAAKTAGVDGYCPKGTPLTELIPAMETVAGGGSYWREEILSTPIANIYTDKPPLPAFARLRRQMQNSAISYIQASLGQINAQLEIPGQPVLERAILAGRRRELLAARWLIKKILAAPEIEKQQEQIPELEYPQMQSSVQPSPTSAIINSVPSPTPNPPPLLSPRAIQSALFASMVTKLQFSLQNVTDVTLEIDILREDKRRELLYIILQKLADLLDDVRTAEIGINQLPFFSGKILSDLWKAASTDFFGKFTKVKVNNNNLEIVNLLLEEEEIVKTEILDKIPLSVELLSYLLFHTDLTIDNTSYPVASPEAKEQGSMLLENVLIQVANAVMQPLLNKLADVGYFKAHYYDKQLMSSREIEKFRNDLSWRYRLNKYVNEAQEIFESRYSIFVFAPRGIAKTSIYAHRSNELAQLEGIPLAVTLILEFRDAIAPRLQSLVSLLGSGVVFLLTKIIGRGIGLIGRGVLQGIGSVSLSPGKKKIEQDKDSK